MKPQASIQLRAIYIPPANTMLARVASPARLLGVPHHLVTHRQHEFHALGLGPVTAVVVGSHKALYK